ncbi:PoNe immunity protein domain-containing protein [Ascidiimonas aurantiaca]|uniref:PoNe immunity protein domain-containing protein n=1 Tax=Ascidiimonas aurantiaca TaxID=1685432 RepID=UPI0030EDB95D
MKISRSPGYYDACIKKNNNTIERRENEVKNFVPNPLNDVMPGRPSNESIIASNKLVTFSLRLDNLSASFSRGDDLNELRKRFSETVQVMGAVWDKKYVKIYEGRERKEVDRYYLDHNIQMRWMLALSVLLDVPEEEFTILYDLVNRDRIKDALYDYLISYRVPDRELSEKVYPEVPFNNIRVILVEENKAQCEAMIKHYLEKEWLKTYKNTGWAKAHLYPEEKYSFFGMWAFEVAAIVKIKGLDDHSFRDHIHYPDRLLHK